MRHQRIALSQFDQWAGAPQRLGKIALIYVAGLNKQVGQALGDAVGAVE